METDDLHDVQMITQKELDAIKRVIDDGWTLATLDKRRLRRLHYAASSAAELKSYSSDLQRRLGKPRCLECNRARISHCSDFINCGGTFKYELEEKAENLEKIVVSLSLRIAELEMEKEH